MHFEKIARCTKSLRRQCHRGHETTVAGGFSITSTRSLNAVGAVHDHRRHDVEHIGNVAEIDHEVVVAEGIAAFREPNLLRAGVASLFDRVAHVATAQKLCFFDVHRASCPRRRHEQIGLTAEERRNLQHIAHFGDGRSLPRLVDVGEDAQTVLRLHLGEHFQSAFQSRTAKRADARAVGLVERCLEDDVGAERSVDAHEFLGDGVEQFGRFDDAGACDENRIHIFLIVFVTNQVNITLWERNFNLVLSQRVIDTFKHTTAVKCLRNHGQPNADF